MSKITVHAGDFKTGGSHYYSNLMGQHSLFMSGAKTGFGQQERIHVNQIDQIEVASEASFRKIGGAIGWGAAGFVVLGPLGLLAAFAGGKRKEITFVASLKDGRKMMASTDAATYRKLAAAAF